MNSFDTVILGALTQLQLPPQVNYAIGVIADFYTFKGYLLIPLLWWIWFQPHERRGWRREIVLATLASALIALAVGRLLARVLPYRERPLFTPGLNLHFASSPVQLAGLMHWSSFPSDHAMLWTAVAMGIFLVWRGIGILAFVSVAAFVCFPRAYLGYHYPTDLLVGAVIGIVITWIMTRRAVRRRTVKPFMRYVMRYPGPVAAVGFLLCFELVTQFDDLLRLARSVLHTVT
ncbi:phosphatase PAP2 family protein [Paraburkholderia sp. CNPSo 3272]|uniref:phosphatase PAP2 family protein n=1 Tax=Paraburkholderia sp. CNPSo 3272 TaxID=2940931 RepID=UPI0020B65FDA|nr:phosphatase PAP2 family protein [Paraburkholderia sp. CNPSo 3272]MCP3726053.1 phosphatase PAP2 family protein [Paraburkholderia sp. CNPSo 3272]